MPAKPRALSPKAPLVAMESMEEEEEEEEEEETDLISLTTSELREMLSERGLSTTGLKADLVKRLESSSIGGQGASFLGSRASSLVGDSPYGHSLERSLGASKDFSHLFTLNERLGDILENEAHKDKAVMRSRLELKTLRATHAQDLADLSLNADIQVLRKQSLHGASLLRESEADAASSLEQATAKLKKSEALEAQVAGDNAGCRASLAETMSRGDALALQIAKAASATAACLAKTQKVKGDVVVSDAWASLYDAALEGIAQEGVKHDPQRDAMVDKLKAIIADVTDENNGQVAMMERHSREIIQESKDHLVKTFEERALKLREKYGRLRKVVEAAHEEGDEALAKHQQFLEDHYRTKFEEKYESLGALAEELEGETAEYLDEERKLTAEVSELSTEATEQTRALKEAELQSKELSARLQQTQLRIATLRDEVYDARSSQEEAERKEKKIEVDYEILMTENSSLVEEVDKFGEMILRAEKGLAAAPPPRASKSVSKRSTEKGSSSDTGLSAITEEYKSPRGASAAGSQSGKKSSGKKRKSPNSGAVGGSGKKSSNSQ
mmetsp:Transcript_39104/g.87481  ORF Transcript_39104/g.87481 Transcript_39104/m.87481 type:complete len:558 (+) Transcript_39104:152-1825(+)